MPSQDGRASDLSDGCSGYGDFDGGSHGKKQACCHCIRDNRTSLSYWARKVDALEPILSKADPAADASRPIEGPLESNVRPHLEA
jgi:hypothetical protein